MRPKSLLISAVLAMIIAIPMRGDALGAIIPKAEYIERADAICVRVEPKARELVLIGVWSPRGR